MALEMFLRIDGVTGGSRNYQHKGWADVLSWTWGLTRANGGGASPAEGMAQMNQISIVKTTGMDSPAMMLLFAEQTVIPSAQISVVPVVGKREAQQKYVEIALDDVVIHSIETGGDTADNLGRETVKLVFGKIKYEFHHEIAATHGGDAASSSSYVFAWDCANGARIAPA
jgi:type VI secretion system secreted protein Hcp